MKILIINFQNNLKYKIMKSWKTTLIGAILAACVAIQPLFESGEYDYKRLVFAGLIALLGALMKDYDKTGDGKKKPEVMTVFDAHDDLAK